jgi:hypothetical protein
MQRTTRLATVLAVVVAGFGDLGLAFAQAAEPGAATGLLGYWRFDDGQGEVAKDSSGQGHDGKIVAGQWVRGPAGPVLRFDGERSHVLIPALPGLDGAEELTLTVWVFWEGVGRYPNLVTGGAWNPGGFLLFVCDDTCSFRLGKPGPVAWEIGSTWQETGASLLRHLDLGRWYHLAATFKRPTLTTYADGEPVASASWSFPIGQTGEICVGRWGLDQGKTQSHYGLIADLRIHNRALTPAEIRGEFASGR